MKRKTLMIMAVLLLLLGAVGAWVAANTVSETRKIWQNDALAQEVMQGRLFAVQKFLAKQAPALPQQSWRRWQSAAKEGGNTAAPVLLWVENVDRARAEDYDELLDWVAAGNHVVLPLLDEESSADAASEVDTGAEGGLMNAQQYRQWLASRLGVRIGTAAAANNKTGAVPAACQAAENQRQQAARATNHREDNKAAPQRLAECAQQLNQIRLPEGRTLAWMAPATQTMLLNSGKTALWQGEGASGSHIVRVAYGQGSVVLLSNWDALAAPQYPPADVSGLNQYDHAYLAAYLAQDKSAVWFVRQLGSPPPIDTAPAWWRLWQAEPLLMGALVLLVAAGVWYLSMRMGALRQLPVPQERYLSEHLAAQGQFLARKPLRGAQLQWLQQQLWQQWQQQWAHWAQMDGQARMQAVCRHTGAPPAVVRLWLQPVPPQPTAAQWLAYLRSHQRILRAKKPSLFQSTR
ncbi:DUF4350 domain-containing protein [Paralysiella testudinis]|uniref:DUF4350 domain-containing protein n=1 Tax=Paralysiella testudinis TaxID=2809020 RepID=A0A892ZJV5_9NEIS|nr:DUF4350 domain-containing protein [Paralysiella testudinis]QRQ81179.1 hypothetical protein JQU52_10675 [Paralysiella testudinis]